MRGCPGDLRDGRRDQPADTRGLLANDSSDAYPRYTGDLVFRATRTPVWDARCRARHCRALDEVTARIV